MSLEDVNPYLGSIGHLLTAVAPVVCRPHAMVGMVPAFEPEMNDLYLATRIRGFPVPVNLHDRKGCPLIMPVTGASIHTQDVSSEFDHDLEEATPFRYSVLLERYDIQVDCLSADHALLYRFRFPEGQRLQMVFRGEGSVTSLDGGRILRGSTMFPSGRESSFFTRFSSTLQDKVAFQDGWLLRFVQGKDPFLEVRIGVSFLGMDQAASHLEEEMGERSFEDLESEARRVWKEMLDRIQVRGGTSSQRRTFTTALWRTMTRMQCVSEKGRYWSGYDHKVHEGEDPFYVTDQIWDTFRSAHPLRILIDPARELDMVRSYVRTFQQAGCLARFPGVDGDRPCMLGHHAIPMIVDAYRKQLRDFDVEAAYQGMRKSVAQATKLPWRNGPFTELDGLYWTLGYFPALFPHEKEWIPEVHPFEKRQAVSVTLECCYDEYCLARMAEVLGKQDDAVYFKERGRNYRKLYHPNTGFMSPRAADGRWIEPFDPKLSGGQGGRDYYAECNAWTYTWSVQHDVAGLAQLMGGIDVFQRRLDQLFEEQYDTPKFKFLAQFPDSTGLIGQFVAGNEPSFHIPYLYNYVGSPWKAQRRIRQIMDVWFCDGPLGLCGDEDGGAMSAWHVFNAMGFFPVCPGEPYYCLGSPVFESVDLDLGEGRHFKVLAEDVSSKNKYIQSAMLNGQEHGKPWFSHECLREGGQLVLNMGPRPNKLWGSQPKDAPPSLSR